MADQRDAEPVHLCGPPADREELGTSAARMIITPTGAAYAINSKGCVDVMPADAAWFVTQGFGFR
jgi:hypothetical protein